MSSKYEGTERIGLYIMVIIILLNTCDTNEKISKIEKKENIKQEYVLKH